MKLILSSFPFLKNWLNISHAQILLIDAWILFSAALLLFLITLLSFIRDLIHTKRVQRLSTKYAALSELNEAYIFHDIKKQYALRKRFNNKSSYDRADFHQFMLSVVKESDELQNLSDIADENWALFDYYCSDFDSLPSSPDYIIDESHVGKARFLRIEEELCDSIFQCPVTELSVTAIFSYTSPQGRNHYEDREYYTHEDIRNLFDERDDFFAYQQTKEYQRALMTPSLRYDVMKRDQFRCCICGASVQDGIKLHVDHILPVSKGGQTEFSNLRTLCDRCNLGKSNKYDEFGIN